MAEIKKGNIIVNYNREWIGVFDKWNHPHSNCHWQWSLYKNHLTKEGLTATMSSALPATQEEKEKFKKALLKEGYSYCRGKIIKEL